MSKKGPHGSDFDHTIRSKSVQVGAVFLEARIHHLVTGTYPSCDRRMPIEVARTKEANGRIVPAICNHLKTRTKKRCSQP